MGVWGPEFNSNDFVLDIRNNYRNLLRIGIEDDRAEDIIIRHYMSALPQGHPDEMIFWLALAVSQWEKGRLSNSTREMALRCLKDNTIIENYPFSKNKGVAQQQRKSLERIGETIQSPQPVRKKIPITKGKHSPWPVGALLAYRICLSEDLKNHPLFGKYALIRVVQVQRQPISRIAPSSAYDESILLGVYGWIGDQVPDPSVLGELDYIPFSVKKPLVMPDAPAMKALDKLPRGQMEQIKRDFTEVTPVTCLIISHYYFREVKRSVTLMDCDPAFERSTPAFFNTAITACPIGNPAVLEHRLVELLLPYRGAVQG